MSWLSARAKITGRGGTSVNRVRAFHSQAPPPVHQLLRVIHVVAVTGITCRTHYTCYLLALYGTAVCKDPHQM
eukprot:957574-Pelagomonas_calceolata.AAC.3